MNRRSFIASASALALMPMAVQAAQVQYQPGMVGKALKAGETVFLDFYTDWCTTCRAQERIISQLLGDNPDYEENITFIKVDWDVHSRSSLAQQLNIPRRSTLVALKGNKEIGRIVAGTSAKDIKALMDDALDAATA